MGRLVVGLVAVLALPVNAAVGKARTDGSKPAPRLVAKQVTHVPAKVLNKVGAGEIAGPRTFGVFKLDSPLTSNGKPELLTLNLAWCPHCAANNWALAIALSRFGRVHGLRVINTGKHYCKVAHDSCALKPAPCFPFTNGLSFFGARFQSRYLSFAEVVFQDVHGHNLQQPTPSEQDAMSQFDPFGQTPAVDVGGSYAFLNSGYSPGVLAHKTWSQIAGSLADAHSPVARHIDGLANLFSAAICSTTGGRPGGVCNSSGVRAAGGPLAHAGPPPPAPPPTRGGPPGP